MPKHLSSQRPKLTYSTIFLPNHFAPLITFPSIFHLPHTPNHLPLRSPTKPSITPQSPPNHLPPPLPYPTIFHPWSPTQSSSHSSHLPNRLPPPLTYPSIFHLHSPTQPSSTSINPFSIFKGRIRPPSFQMQFTNYFI
jgi:hypothetical protein